MDPYKVLGVPESATDEEVKKAYRDLVRKYHPDKYVDNPLADVASEKMKEINAAYDQITKERKEGKQRSSYGGGAQGSYYSGQGYYGGGYYGQSGYSSGYQGNFSDVRRMISQNRIAEAEEILDGVPEYKRGWLSEAARCFQRAYQMEPNNREYASAYQQCAYRQQYGTPGGGGQGGSFCACDPCDICTGLMCLDCLCRGC